MLIDAMDDFTGAVMDWYARSGRTLPWREPGIGAWSVLVSEFMLQQTPVARVLPAYEAWLARWPDPAALAADSVGEAVRMWGRLGYPRRALRLHACAVVIVEEHGGSVPADLDALLALPGVGDYTGRAVASFAFRARHPVVDTNVRRVLARVLRGTGDPGPVSATRDLALAASVLPVEAEDAATYAVAVMELGALVCTARSPLCERCPVSALCAWFQTGRPAYEGPVRATQRFAGTDRQVRGLLLAVVRDASKPVVQTTLDDVWTEPIQRSRALDSLIIDGLVDVLPDGRFALPA